MSLSIDMLATFVKVADTLSVSVAARELGTSKSAVSKRVAQLEASVRATLFSRSTRKVALTPAGETYLAHARRALAEIDAAEERLRGLRSELTGTLRVTAPVSWGQRVLAKRLPAFLHRHPLIEVELQLADRMLDLAFERVDIGLRWSDHLAPGMAATPVADVAWVLAASPAYLASAGALSEPADLVHHPCMSYWRESSDDAWTLAQGVRREHVRVKSRYHVNNPEAVADAALDGLGVALLPSYLCDDALLDGRLVTLLPQWVPQTRFGTRIHAVATPERMAVARNKAFLQFMLDAFTVTAPGRAVPASTPG